MNGESNSGWPDTNRRKTWRSFGLSLLTHPTILLCLLFLVRGPQAGSDGEPEGRRVNVVLTEIADAAQMTSVPGNSKGEHEYELSEDDLKMIAEDQRQIRAEMPVGEEASISLFGSGNLDGRKFVFVIDRSQSMGGGGLGVLQRAATELKSAVDQLESNHSFQVVGYHAQTVTISNRSLLPATPANKELVPKFVQSLAAYGSTSHEAGLTAALTFRPDVVVLMTDGGLPELHAGHLDSIRRMARGAEIHCLQFGAGPLQNSDNFMSQLAAENDGTSRYIDVRKWDE